MKQRENLARFRRTIVYINNRKHIVVEAKARIVLNLKSVFKHIDANCDEGLTPSLQSFIVIRPCGLLVERDTEIIAHLRREILHRCLRCKLEVAGYPV